jgi:hypothetical protein
VSVSDYRNLRHSARVVCESDEYRLCECQMNPNIYRDFADKVKQNGGNRVWEPFASNSCRALKYFAESGVELKQQSLYGWGKCIHGDSTKQGPPLDYCPIDGFIFHPPYFAPMNTAMGDGDLGGINDCGQYIAGLKQAAGLCISALKTGGLACAVGRRYRFAGSEVRLDEWMVEVFSDLAVHEVWTSVPDVVIIFKK